MLFQPRTLQQRTLLFILAPTLLLLMTLSVSGFLFVRNILLNQWGETAVAKLQRTAHVIDMELRRPKDLLSLLQSVEGGDVNRTIFNHIVEQIKGLEGVVEVKVKWPARDIAQEPRSPMMATKSAMGMMHRYQLEQFEIGTPRYNSQLNNRTVSLISTINDKDDMVVGRVEVIISFDQLIDQIVKAPWWMSNKAYLLDREGNVLTSTTTRMELEDYFPMRAFGTVSDLEKKTLAAIRVKNSGTVFGSGSPPEEISGFYHLTEAPWTIVIMAPGEKVLQPIIRFKLVYFLSFTICILLVLFFIMQTTNRLTTRIKKVSAAADDLAKGRFGPPSGYYQPR